MRGSAKTVTGKHDASKNPFCILPPPISFPAPFRCHVLTRVVASLRKKNEVPADSSLLLRSRQTEGVFLGVAK